MRVEVVPSSSGPLAPLAELSITAPDAAQAGRVVPVVATVRARSTGPRKITTPRTSALLVVSGDRVVARQDGPEDVGAIPLILHAGRMSPAQAVPSAVRLVSSGTGEPLVPGRYALVAVLGYQNDSFNSAADLGLRRPPTGGRPFVLVSRPVPLEVRAG